MTKPPLNFVAEKKIAYNSGTESSNQVVSCKNKRNKLRYENLIYNEKEKKNTWKVALQQIGERNYKFERDENSCYKSDKPKWCKE